MASWKKMAEAFGRAMKDPGASREGKELVKKAITIDDGTPNLSERLDRDVAYTKGRRDANAENLDDLGKSRDERQAAFDKRSDERTNKSLEEKRDDEWDAAFRHAQGVMELPDDEMNDVLRSLIKELKPRGFTEQDILNSLRSLGEKEYYGTPAI